MIGVLVFALPGDVVACFEELTNYIQAAYNNDYDKLLKYFGNTYIGLFRQNSQRCHPILSINMWNIFHRTQQKLPRTNNSIEGWHINFPGSVSACHPTI